MFEKGSRVRVEYPQLNNILANGMFKYNHKVTTVKEVVHYAGYNQNAYLLEECVSPCGLYYEFVDEWLVGAESEESDDTETASD